MLDLSEPSGGLLIYLLIWVIILLLCILVKGRHWLSALNRKYRDIPHFVMLVGAYGVLWYYSIRSGSHLESFGMPQNASDLESSQQVMYYLKMYNEQIVRNGKILNQTLFLSFLVLFNLVIMRWGRINEEEVVNQ